MYKLGIDLGGTNIVAGVVDESYNILAKVSVKTKAPRPAEKIADDIAKACLSAMEKAGLTIEQIDTVGIGSPGSIDSENGIVVSASNLKFKNAPLARLVGERLGKEAFLENDANAAAYGEFLAGAGKGTNSFIAVTLGTGVGGGIIIDGKIYSGFNNAAGELGHTIICYNGEACSCGRKGCWETYASVTGLIRQTKQMMLHNPQTKMWDECGGSLENVDGLTAFSAMRKGDYIATAVVDQYLEYIAVGVTNFIATFQPEVLCIGGGISKEGATLVEPVKKYADTYSSTAKKTEIKTATLGNDAGVIGAAFLSDMHK